MVNRTSRGVRGKQEKEEQKGKKSRYPILFAEGRGTERDLGKTGCAEEEGRKGNEGKKQSRSSVRPYLYFRPGVQEGADLRRIDIVPHLDREPENRNDFKARTSLILIPA